jgi:hypothetical protein
MPQVDNDDFKFPDEIENQVSTEIEVEIEDDTPEEDRGRTPMPKELIDELEQDELESYDDTVKTRLKQMRKVWHDERREKEAALREQKEALTFAQKLLDENKRIKNILTAGEKEYATSIQSVAAMELEAAKKEYKDAFESGDSDRVLDAQQQLQDANMKVLQAKNFKLPPLQEEETSVEQQNQYNSVQPNSDHKALSWQERNVWFGKNKAMTAFALGVHEELQDNGVKVGSDDYYKTIDKTMRKRFPEAFDAEESRPAKTKSSTVVAPAVRSTGSNKIRLKSSQVQIAKKLGITPEQYARELMKLES